MAYLALDTSTQALSVALGTADGTLLGEHTEVVAKGHSFRLMPMIDRLLDECQIDPSDLTGIVIGQGPGSYTGVRVGVTAGKSLAWSLGVPLVGVSSLDGIARHLSDSDWMICPLIDARRQQAYGAVYEQREGEFIKVVADQLLKVDGWLEAVHSGLTVRQLSGNPAKAAFLGDGAVAYRTLIVERLGDQANFPEDQGLLPMRAAHLLDVGIPRLQKGQSDDVGSFSPEYLQLAEAEAKWLANQKAESEPKAQKDEASS